MMKTVLQPICGLVRGDVPEIFEGDCGAVSDAIATQQLPGCEHLGLGVLVAGGGCGHGEALAVHGVAGERGGELLGNLVDLRVGGLEVQLHKQRPGAAGDAHFHWVGLKRQRKGTTKAH